jgi:hypothetical protein
VEDFGAFPHSDNSRAELFRDAIGRFIEPEEWKLDRFGSGCRPVT